MKIKDIKTEFIYKKIPAVLLCIALCLSLVSCKKTPEKQTRTWYDYFETICTIISYDSPQNFDIACNIVEDELKRYNELCDIYNLYGDLHNACYLNMHAGEGPVSIPDELLSLLMFSQSMYALTNGECNIAFGAVLSIWHEARENALNGNPPYIPGMDELNEAALHCDINGLVLDDLNCTAELLDSEMSIDLGAVTKGYVADIICYRLAEAGLSGYAVNLGGNVKTIGCKIGEEPWITGIASPDENSDSAYLEKVKLVESSLVTSGSYQRYYEYNGERYHHIISPETLMPKNDFLSVTILAGSSGIADALSTAVFNMDYAEGLDFINSLSDIEAAWVFPDMCIKYSDNFESLIVE